MKQTARFGFGVAGVLTSILLLAFTPAVAASGIGSVGAWTTSSNHVPLDMSGAATVISNDYVYVIGGSSSSGGSWLSSTYYAKLASDGSVGAWTTSSNALPHGVYYPSAVAINNYIYVMGGYGGGFQNAVYYAKVNSDGSIGSWTTSSNSLPQAIYDATAVTHNGYIYFTGGLNGSFNALNTTYYAKVNSDGSIGSWTTSSNSLPQGVYNEGAAVTNNHLYILGGSTNTSTTNATYYTSFNNDGSIGSWTTNSVTLPQALDGPTTATSNGYLYLTGGNNNVGTTQSGVYYAKVNSDGSIGSWTTSSNSLPQSLQFSGSVTHDGYLYVVTGQNNGLTQNSVYYAPLNFVSQQSITDTVGSQTVLLSTPLGSNITSFSTIPDAGNDNGYTYPLGLATFTFTTDNVTNQVTLIFQTSQTPNQVSARKYDPTNHTYSTVPGAVITQTTLNGKAALQVTYTLTDGGQLDEDGTANGTVIDPIGLAQANGATQTGSVSAPNTGYGKPTGRVQYSIGVILLGSGIGVLSATMFGRSYRNKHTSGAYVRD